MTTDNTQAELPPNAKLDPNSILAPAPGEVERAVIVAAMIANKHFTIDEAYAYLAAYTNKQVLAIIGEDETYTSDKWSFTPEAHARDELRAEQRIKLKETKDV